MICPDLEFILKTENPSMFCEKQKRGNKTKNKMPLITKHNLLR